MTQTQTLTRKQIRVIFGKNRGAAFALAAELGISRTTVSQWLRGKMTSQRIAEAAGARAAELTAHESTTQSKVA